MSSFSIPLFPLSNVVLFPGCLAPLHIFELRYRQMTEAALEGERLIGMVTVRPDAREEMGGNPPIYAVGCAGFITDHQRHPDAIGLNQRRKVGSDSPRELTRCTFRTYPPP